MCYCPNWCMHLGQVYVNFLFAWRYMAMKWCNFSCSYCIIRIRILFHLLILHERIWQMTLVVIEKLYYHSDVSWCDLTFLEFSLSLARLNDSTTLGILIKDCWIYILVISQNRFEFLSWCQQLDLLLYIQIISIWFC